MFVGFEIVEVLGFVGVDGGGCGAVAVVDFDGDFVKGEFLAEDTEEVTAPGAVDFLGVAAFEDERGGLCGDLGGVVDSEPASGFAGGGIFLHGLADHLVQLRGGDACAGLLVDGLGEVDELLGVVVVFGGDAGDGHEAEHGEHFDEVLAPVCGGHVLLTGEVPLVDDEDAGFEVVLDLLDDLFIDLGDALDGVEEHEDDIGASDAAFGADESVVFDIVGEAFAFADAGGVDGEKGLAVEFETDVDAVAGGAGDFADDHAFGLGEGVDEGAFSDVAASDNRQFHFGLFLGGGTDGGFFGGGGGEDVEDGFDELFAVAFTEDTGADERPLGEAVELGDFEVLLGGVALVGDEENGLGDAAQTATDFEIERDDSGLAIDDEHDDVGLIDAFLDLGFDFFSEVIDIDDSDSAGIDEFEVASLFVEDEGDSVAGDASGGVDDGDAFAGEPIEEGTFPDIGASDDGHLGDRHN